MINNKAPLIARTETTVRLSGRRAFGEPLFFVRRGVRGSPMSRIA